MNTTTASPLRQRMIEDMSLRNLAPAPRQPTSAAGGSWQRSCAAHPSHVVLRRAHLSPRRIFKLTHYPRGESDEA